MDWQYCFYVAQGKWSLNREPSYNLISMSDVVVAETEERLKKGLVFFPSLHFLVCFSVLLPNLPVNTVAMAVRIL